MIRVPVLYPNISRARFDAKYYLEKHMPLVRERLGMEAHGQELLADIPNYTSVQAQVQISELLSV